jgi:hypothetical protein
LHIEISHEGNTFTKNYFTELMSIELSKNDELKLIQVSIESIKEVDKIEYDKVKFLMVIRTELKIDHEPIFDIHPDF